MEQELKISITGMTCANCVGRVERAIAGIEGVESAVVNLMTESAVAKFDPKRVKEQSILDAVTEAGYTPNVIDIENRSIDNSADENYQRDRRNLILAASLAVPELLISMIPMLVPGLHHRLHQAMPETYWLWLEFLLATPVVFIFGFRFFKTGWAELRHLSPGMNSLVMIGAGSAWLYSVAVILLPGLFPPGTANVYFEAAAVIVTLILAGKLLEARSKGRASQAIRRLVELQPKQARILRDGEIVEIPVETIVPGDLVLVRPGEQIPVDGAVSDGSSWVDESMLTGEPLPIQKEPGSDITAGSINKTGTFTFLAQRVGSETRLARIIELVQSAQASKPPIQMLADKIAGIFVPIVMVAALLTFILWYILGPDPSLNYAFAAALSVLVVACPCAMGLATPTGVMVGSGKAAEMGILFRKGTAIEALSQVDVVLLDKTGTITAGHPEVTSKTMFGIDEVELFSLIVPVEERSEHPIARAVVESAKSIELKGYTVESFVAHAGMGVEAMVNGKQVMIGTGRFLSEQGIDLEAGSDFLDEASKSARTVISVAIDRSIKAMLAISDPIKPDSAVAIKALKQLGLQVQMVSGDNRMTAESIAREVGIDEVFAEVLPEGKNEVVASLQKRGLQVLFVGDGINDSPALAVADVGMAIGTGTDVAIETADVILMSGDLRGVANAIALARKTLRTIRLNFIWAYGYNILLIPVAAGVFYPLTGHLLSPMLAAAAMSLSSLFVISNSLRLKKFRPVVG